MTLEEFLAELEKTPRDWVLIEDRIRTRSVRQKRISPNYLKTECDCPITRVCGDDIGLFDWDIAAERLGLDHQTGGAIMGAADGDKHSPIRLRLLKACGLAP